jgi:hypothetical protein
MLWSSFLRLFVQNGAHCSQGMRCDLQFGVFRRDCVSLLVVGAATCLAFLCAVRSKAVQGWVTSVSGTHVV